jgi:hypothetical protein
VGLVGLLLGFRDLLNGHEFRSQTKAIMSRFSCLILPNTTSEFRLREREMKTFRNYAGFWEQRWKSQSPEDPRGGKR